MIFAMNKLYLCALNRHFPFKRWLNGKKQLRRIMDKFLTCPLGGEKDKPI
jgi:hypothetical protein